MLSPYLARAARVTAVALILFAIPAIAYALTLTSGGGILFDVTDTTNGSLTNGTNNAYDGAYYIDLNGARYSALGAASTLTMGGRQIETTEQLVTAGIRVRRLIYVPTTGGDYARYVDILSNPTAADVFVAVRLTGNLGSDTTTNITATSSGDTALTVADTWFASDDSMDGAGAQSLGHVFQGLSGARLTASAATLIADNFSWQFTVRVPAMGRVAIMSFAVQAMNRAAAAAEAARLSGLPADALMGLEPYAADILNFDVGGAPQIGFTAPLSADEGDEITIDVAVSDFEGDPVTWTWDTDGDGTFGELPDMTSFTVPAGTTDGNGDLVIAVEATDGLEGRVGTRTIHIRNVAPVIGSSAPTTAQVRREYMYAMDIQDPGGDLDPPMIRLLSRPGGMVVDAAGVITWTPMVEFRGLTVPVTASVDDGDGGTDEESWEILVAQNQAPMPAAPLMPIEHAYVAPEAPVTVTVTNGTDPDGDPLLYFFQASRTSSFTGTDLIGSGELSEEPDGTTSWTTPTPLQPGLWYWRVWVGDGIEETAPVNASFVVGIDPATVDAGPPDRPDAFSEPDGGPGMPRTGGCSVSAVGVGAESAATLALLGIAIAIVIVRRKEKK